MGGCNTIRICSCGEIGKHKGLKIPRQKLVGSSPTGSTEYYMIRYLVKIYFDGGYMEFVYDAPEATAALTMFRNDAIAQKKLEGKVLTHYEVGPV